MDEHEISCALSSFKWFGGVFAFNEKPDCCKLPIGIVVNTQGRDKSGMHWIALYIDENGNGEFMDSLASNEVFDQFRPYLETNCFSYLIPAYPLQSSISQTCGIYACAFLALRFEGMQLVDFMKIFSRSTLWNDFKIGEIISTIKEPARRCKDHLNKHD